MTTAKALLADLRSRGVELETDGQRLRWRPQFMVGHRDAELLLHHRGDLIDLLSSPEGARGPLCPRCRWPLDSVRRCPRCFDRLCVDCGRPSGSYFILRCAGCGHTIAEKGDSDEPDLAVDQAGGFSGAEGPGVNRG